MKIKEKQKLTKKWFKDLQNLICKNIEDLEKKYGSRKKFKKNRWKHGEFRIIEGVNRKRRCGIFKCYWKIF